MAKADKKKVREWFNKAVFERANYLCQGPGCPQRKVSRDKLDAHHITDRHEMPNGGYVPTNGISLCAKCHWLAEAYHRNEEPQPGFWPFELYEVIESSYEDAVNESNFVRH